MKFLEWAKDGGPDSHVSGFFIVEIKSLFSIVLLRFGNGTREAFHSHAFSALTLWLKGKVKEHLLSGESHYWYAGDLKYTSKKCFHKVEAMGDAWALSFRGPWVDRWRENVKGTFTTLTHGRKVVSGL
jgi:hypothetical protein